MADKGTEQATPQRKKKARERGDRVHSRELLSAMSMLGGVMMLGVLARVFLRIGWMPIRRACASAASGVSGQNGELLLNGA